MQFFSTAALLLAASLSQAVFGHNIQLPAHDRECFHEELRKDDKMTVTFQVGDREFGGAGNLAIDFSITRPSGKMETFQQNVPYGDYTFDAKEDGKHIYCFSNEHWGANSKEVSFNVHGIVYVSEHEADKDPLETEGKCKTLLARPDYHT
ncbi:emp24/gp25L/p24 family/GOLD-domain-containing protein [Xylariales sp. PMI_506]|nr:emp24/gp25L/p24 family/GOLD-domain-containing protein [Xylariales sp. PMI_506]